MFKKQIFKFYFFLVFKEIYFKIYLKYFVEIVFFEVVKNLFENIVLEYVFLVCLDFIELWDMYCIFYKVNMVVVI